MEDDIIELNCCPDCGSHQFVVDWNVKYSCDICKNYFDENIIKYKIIKENKMEITKEEYDQLKEDSLKLGCLEAAGVDNWGGYDYAFELMRDLKKEKENETRDNTKD